MFNRNTSEVMLLKILASDHLLTRDMNNQLWRIHLDQHQSLVYFIKAPIDLESGDLLLQGGQVVDIVRQDLISKELNIYKVYNNQKNELGYIHKQILNNSYVLLPFNLNSKAFASFSYKVTAPTHLYTLDVKDKAGNWIEVLYKWDSDVVENFTLSSSKGFTQNFWYRDDSDFEDELKLISKLELATKAHSSLEDGSSSHSNDDQSQITNKICKSASLSLVEQSRLSQILSEYQRAYPKASLMYDDKSGTTVDLQYGNWCGKAKETSISECELQCFNAGELKDCGGCPPAVDYVDGVCKRYMMCQGAAKASGREDDCGCEVVLLAALRKARVQDECASEYCRDSGEAIRGVYERRGCKCEITESFWFVGVKLGAGCGTGGEERGCVAEIDGSPFFYRMERCVGSEACGRVMG